MRKEFEELILEESKIILKKALEGEPISVQELEIIKLANNSSKPKQNTSLLNGIENILSLVASFLGGN